MNAQLWLAFLITATALAFVPGPAVLYVIGQGVRHGAAKSVAATAGVLSGNAIYFALSAAGLATIVALAAPVFVAIKWLGVVYLAWLGLCAWRDAWRGAAAKPRASARSASSGVRIWRQGVLLQLANPKAVLFFTALLPQFIDTAHAVAPQVLVLAVTSIVSECFVLVAYGWIGARGGTLLMTQPRFARVSDAAAGTCLIGAGVGLALAHPMR